MDEIKIKIAESEKEKEECMKIRKKVFVEREKIFAKDDKDEFDTKSSTIHLVAYYRRQIWGTVRICEEKEGIFRGSRLAVLEGAHPLIAIKLIKKAVEVVKSKNAKEFKAYVRPHLIRLFQRSGWKWKGENVYYAGTEHLIMYAFKKDEGIF